jgi:2-hydroxychromene-2-carboxylate isomerase
MVWAEDRDIASKSSLREVIGAQKLPSDQILIEADSPAVIAQYLANTQEAVEAQVFGAPWYVFEEIPYWGQDRLDFLERAFAGTLPRAGPN